MSLAPRHIRADFIHLAKEIDQPMFTQVATIDAKGKPHVRTIHLHYFEALDVLCFDTHIQSAKWQQLAEEPNIAGAFYHLSSRTQYRFEGRVDLLTTKSRSKKKIAILDQRWGEMRHDVRTSYWRDFTIGDSSFDVDSRCPNFGVVAIKPTVWDCYHLTKEHGSDKRFRYELKAKGWHESQVSILHGQSSLP